MASLNTLKRQLETLEAKHSRLLRQGQLVMAMNLSSDISRIRDMIATEEELRKPKPIRELVPKDELVASGLVELAMELHLAADYINAISCEITDVVNGMGFEAVTVIPELKEVEEKSRKVASYMCTLDQNLSDMMTDNETLMMALHKKTQSYIAQRMKPKKNKKTKKETDNGTD